MGNNRRWQNKQPLLISCYFGNHIRKIHPAPRGWRCVFFCNNPVFERELSAQGWEFRLVSRYPIIPDWRVASLQSKYVKFLGFLQDFPEFTRFSRIIYFDHSVWMGRKDVRWILRHHSRENAVLLLRHAAIGRTVDEEAEVARAQSRYAECMPATLEWMEERRQQGCDPENVLVDATTIISYCDHQRIQPLLDETVETMWRLGQPECQIIWSLLAQKHGASIQRVAWQDLSPRWHVPAPQNRLRSLVRRVLRKLGRRSS